MKKGKLLFGTYMAVESHPILKNSKQIFKNKRTGKHFITSSNRAKKGSLVIINNLLKAKHLEGLETIKCDVIADFIFHYPETSYFTKKGIRNKKLGDLSNLYQAPEDALQKAGILEDDGLIVSHGNSKRTWTHADYHILSIYLYEAIDPSSSFDDLSHSLQHLFDSAIG